MLTSRLMDARRTLVIGLALMAGLAVDLCPAAIGQLPPSAQTNVGTSLLMGTLAALSLNLLVRIGVRETERLTVPPGLIDTAAIRAFMDACGASWGARREVFERASFSVAQSVESIARCGVTSGPITVDASFDEFRLDLRVSYEGEALELPEQRPSFEDLIETEGGERLLAGFLLRQSADRASATSKGSTFTLLLQFNH